MPRNESSYFIGDKDFWDDADFPTGDEKLVYGVCWQAHGTDIAGIRKRNDRLDVIRVGISIRRWLAGLQKIADKGKVSIYDDLIWVRAAIWRNLAKGNYNDTQGRAVANRIKELGNHPVVAEVYALYIDKKTAKYPMYALCIPPPCPIPGASGTEPGLDWSGSGTGKPVVKKTRPPTPAEKAFKEGFKNKYGLEPTIRKSDAINLNKLKAKHGEAAVLQKIVDWWNCPLPKNFTGNRTIGAFIAWFDSIGTPGAKGIDYDKELAE